ncbi:MAG: hypothetical protein WCL06_01830 [Bacteroidota bacterium]
MSANNDFHLPLFNALQIYKIEAEKATFNGLSQVSEFTAHLNYIISLYSTFVNDLDVFVISDAKNKATVLLLLIKKIDEKLYPSLKKQYETFYNSYVQQSPENPENENTIDKTPLKESIHNLNTVSKYHLDMVETVRKSIQMRMDILAFTGEIDAKFAKAFSNTEKQEEPIKNEFVFEKQVKKENRNKLLLNLSKKEIALLFIFLCNNDLAKPANTTELYDFIESNFKFMDNSKNKHEFKDITRINETFARLTNHQEKTSNTRFRNKLISNYQNKIYELFENFKGFGLEKFRDKF